MWNATRDHGLALDARKYLNINRNSTIISLIENYFLADIALKMSVILDNFIYMNAPAHPDQQQNEQAHQ